MFYRRYENRELVNELRRHNLELKQIFQSVDRDRMEYEQQNIILKDEISLLYQKNDDLTQVVSELSRYYFHLKKMSSKVTELSRYLQQPLENLDEKLFPYMSSRDEYDDEYIEEESPYPTEHDDIRSRG